MTTKFLWHIWPGPGRPSSATEEQRFVSDLSEMAEDEPDVSYKAKTLRSHLIVVIGALRCGTDVHTLLEHAPGANPKILLDAYNHLAELLDDSSDAWHASVSAALEEDDDSVFQRRSKYAARVLPVPVGRLLITLGQNRAGWQEHVRRVAARVNNVSDVVAGVEDEMYREDVRPGRAVQLGRDIFDPHAPCLVSNPFFLAPRVGLLSPVRIVDLLGERRDDPHLL